MKLGIMQPYFFPYIGYFDLINRTDRWIVFDTVKYRPKSWMNRNRVLHPTKGWQHITVPVSKVGRERIADVLIVDADAARLKIAGQLEHYRAKGAPFYEAALDLVQRSFSGLKSGTLVELNVQALALTCAYIGIPFEYGVLSQMQLALPPVREPGGWALEIATALGAHEYVNAPNGRELFDRDAFAARGIKLTFAALMDFPYDCRKAEYIAHLSILDVIMWNEPAAIKGRLDAAKDHFAQ